ncbi:MAG: 4-alpha-glucanotransferase [Spirochaetaceae bacterium]|nr:4-alpha-glucanotransferase [Spirochaetaceae bacterium]
MKTNIRNCGVLLHPTSLPSAHGIGSLGDKAFKFIDKLNDMKFSLWQILPLGPTGYGDSPYAAKSTFAGNELIIDLNTLAYEGYLELEEVLENPFSTSERVDYEKVRNFKEPLLRKAALNFIKNRSNDESLSYNDFCHENEFWLEDYALYQVLCTTYEDSRWFSVWDEKVKRRDKNEIIKLSDKYADEILIVKVLQFFFNKQWQSVKSYANKKGIKIIGDVPIFVAGDSVDAWTHPELFKLDENLHQLYNSGVPPDAFSDDGQLWGNPVYDWDKHKETEFNWWSKRIGAYLKNCDIIRIDHFRGLSAYWEVDASEKTAINGKWVPSPGQDLLDVLKKDFCTLPIIAEDLGIITDEVEELRDNNNLPGMKILQFAFGFKNDRSFDANNAYLPHNCIENSVVYTGTHDNDTTLGWYQKLDEKTKDAIRVYLECSDNEVPWELIRACLMSNSKWAIFPMQDILELDSSSRMNTPSTCGSFNWSWRLPSLEMESWREDKFRDSIIRFGRSN